MMIIIIIIIIIIIWSILSKRNYITINSYKSYVFSPQMNLTKCIIIQPISTYASSLFVCLFF
jgi:hypothetical protein